MSVKTSFLPPPGVYWCQIPGAKTGPFFIFQISVMLLWINNCNVCVCNAVYRRLWNVFTYTWKSLNRRSCHRRSCRRRNCRRRNCYREGNPAISKSKLLVLLLNASLLHVHFKKMQTFYIFCVVYELVFVSKVTVLNIWLQDSLLYSHSRWGCLINNSDKY